MGDALGVLAGMGTLGWPGRSARPVHSNLDVAGLLPIPSSMATVALTGRGAGPVWLPCGCWQDRGRSGRKAGGGAWESGGCRDKQGAMGEETGALLTRRFCFLQVMQIHHLMPEGLKHCSTPFTDDRFKKNSGGNQTVLDYR